MSYTAVQWLLIFFAYCFLGWIWESCYVSLKQGIWINRGFLYGPWLPIYGYGAIIILFLTLPVRKNPLLIYVFGMLGATALEYVTGAGMEYIFHMRYWDYSKIRFNINGYICLPVSLAWGVFSILLVEVLHPPVEHLVLSIPGQFIEPLGLALTVLYAADTVISIRAALDLKTLMSKLTENSRMLKRVTTQLGSAMEQLKDNSEQLRRRLAELEDSLAVRHEQVIEDREKKVKSRRDYLLAHLEANREQRSVLLSSLLKKTEIGLDGISQKLAADNTRTERRHLEKMKGTLLDVQAYLHKAELEITERKDRDFQRAVSILHRNPTSVSQHYYEAFSLLKEMRKESAEKRKMRRDNKGVNHIE